MKISFLDLADVDHLENLRHVINPGRMLAEPVLPLGAPGDFDGHSAYTLGSGIVREPDGLFRLWYWGSAGPYDEPDPRGAADYRIGLAVSRDGRRWEKPSLGLVERNGSKVNNLVRIESRCYPGAMSVVRDDEEPDPVRRYKALASHHQGAVHLFSADGLDWYSHLFGNHVYASDPHSDFCIFTAEPYCLLKDPLAPPESRWKSYGQASSGGLWGWQRRLFYAYSADCINWRLHPEPLLGNPLGQPLPGVFRGQVHGAAAIRLGNVIAILCDYGMPHPRRGQFAMETRLAVTRDGKNVTSYLERESLLPMPGPDHWAGGGVATASVLATEDKILLYFAGLRDENGWAGGEGTRDTGVRLGLAEWPLDGLCHLEADGQSPARLISRSLPITPDSPASVTLTARIAEADLHAVSVGVFDGCTLKPIRQAALARCIERVESRTDYSVYHLQRLAKPGTDRIKVLLDIPCKAKLYSIAVAQEPDAMPSSEACS